MALLQCNFFSQALMRTVPIQVVLPTDKTLGPGPQPGCGDAQRRQQLLCG